MAEMEVNFQVASGRIILVKMAENIIRCHCHALQNFGQTAFDSSATRAYSVNHWYKGMGDSPRETMVMNVYLPLIVISSKYDFHCKCYAF